MRTVIIGLGSMGKRRLRLFKQIRPDAFFCGVDRDEVRRKVVAETFGIPVYDSLREAVVKEKPAVAVISTSPLSHAPIISECLNAGLHVFSELNLVKNGYEENMALAETKGKVLFLSSTALYREEPKYIIKRTQESDKPLHYRYHVGQYLPDWHPWESYKNFFVGDARTNGCREILAIELPWLCAAFGPVEHVEVIRGKITQLQLSCDDSYMLLLRHKNGHMGSLCVDVASRKAVRLFEVYGEDIYMSWGGTPDTLCEWDIEKKEDRIVKLYEHTDHREGYASFIVENAYAAELEAFISAVEKGERPRYGFCEDLKTIELLDKIEEKEI